jgi:glucokinase
VLTWDGGAYHVHPSEGSHADFAPVGPLQRDLAAWTEAELGQACEVEHVCCGSGIARIHAFLSSRAGVGAQLLSPAEVTERGAATGMGIAAAGLTRTRTLAALRGECATCVQAVDLFLSILGCAGQGISGPPAPYPVARSAECANLGLKLLARGGVFIAGGIPGKLLPLLQRPDGPLQAAFLRRGCRFEAVRATLPLHVVLSKDPGLDGARRVAMAGLSAQS